MKKFLAIMLAALMLLGLTACGSKNSDKSDNTAESIDIGTLFNTDRKTAESLLGMRLYRDESTKAYKYYKTKNEEWSIVVNADTELVVYAGYSEGNTIINGLTLNMSYDEVANVLTSNGYKIATDESSDELYFKPSDGSFLSYCTFDPETGLLHCIQADINNEFFLDTNLEWSDSYTSGNDNFSDPDGLTADINIESLLNKDLTTVETSIGAEIRNADVSSYPYITYVSENNEWTVEVDISTKKIMGVSYTGSNSVSDEDKINLIDITVAEAEEKTGLKFSSKQESHTYHTTETGWEFWVDTTETVVYATYGDGSETVNGLSMYISYNEAVEILKGQGYKIATDETFNNLFFATADDSFVGLCTFDPADGGCLLSIQADCSGSYIDRFLEWNQ